MRLKEIVPVLILFFCTIIYNSYSQNTLEVMSDTIKIKEIKPKNGKVYDPDKAALLSAVLPGLGHIYVKQYWKVPLVLGGAGAIYWFFKRNNEQYKSIRNAQYLLANPQTPVNIDPEVKRRLLLTSNRQDFLERNERNTRRLRDVTIISGCVAYGLIIVDSYVNAHLKGFTVSKDLSFKVKPSCQPTQLSGPATGIAFNLTIK